MTDKNEQISKQITKEDGETIDWELVGYILDSMPKLITASKKVVNADRLSLEEDLERLRNLKNQRGKLLAEYNRKGKKEGEEKGIKKILSRIKQLRPLPKSFLKWKRTPY